MITDGQHATLLSYKCVQGDGVCSFADTCASGGCIQDAWFAVDLGSARTISRVRVMSDWWSKRPKNYEIWASDSASDVPFSGARQVATGVAHQNPWQCVAGESCADPEVPDECCPNGRDAPQAPATTNLAKYDIQDVEPSAARYWYLVVRDTYEPSFLILRELEFGGPP